MSRAAGGGRAGGGRGRGRGRAAEPALPPNSNSMESFGGPAGFSFDARANEAYVADGYRNHRVAVVDMTSGAIKRFDRFGGTSCWCISSGTPLRRAANPAGTAT